MLAVASEGSRRRGVARSPQRTRRPTARRTKRLQVAEGWAVEVMEVVTVEAKVAKMAVVMAAAAMEAAVKVLDLEARAAEGGRALAR